MTTPRTASTCESRDPRVRRLTKALRSEHKAWVNRQPLQGGRLAGFRTLREALLEYTGKITGSSHEQLRKLYNGRLEWANVNAKVLQGLAYVYGTTLEDLSPDMAAEMAGMGSTQARRKNTCTSSATLVAA